MHPRHALCVGQGLNVHVVLSGASVGDPQPEYQFDADMPQGPAPIAPIEGAAVSASTSTIVFEWELGAAGTDLLYDIRIFRVPGNGPQIDVANEWNLPVPKLILETNRLVNPFSDGARRQLEAAGLGP